MSPSLANEFANLTPASRRQDHTILPSASQALSSEAPLAATASSPASVTIAIRPSSGVDGGGFKVIRNFGKPEYFFGWDWTDRNSLIRFRKLDFTRKSRGARSAPPSQAANRPEFSGRDALDSIFYLRFDPVEGIFTRPLIEESCMIRAAGVVSSGFRSSVVRPSPPPAGCHPCGPWPTRRSSATCLWSAASGAALSSFYRRGRCPASV